jgi:hypothetical protein
MTDSINIHKIDFNISIIYKFLIKILSVISFLELVLFPAWETLYAIFIVFLCVIIHKKTIFNSYNLIYYPASTIAISFYILFFVVLPMPATLIEFKPVTYNLHSTVDTFSNILILELLLILIHFIYRKLSKRKNIIRNILVKFNFYTKVSSNELWILIIASALLWAYIILRYGLYTEESTNTSTQLPGYLYILNLLLSGYSYCLFIFLMPNYNIIKTPYKVNKTKIIIITAILFLIGIATNMRTASVMVIANGFFLFIVYNLYYPIDYKKYLKPKTVIISIVLIYFFTGPFMDISKAMLDTREHRAGKSGIEMIEMTFNSLQDNDKKKQNKKLKESGIIWDEEYLDNDILNRFCSIKILDETLFHAQRAGYANPIMQEHLKIKMIDFIPGIIKKTFNIKTFEETRHYSLTDVLYSLSINSPSARGGVKIGTLQGLGLAIFGYWYFLVLIPIFIIIFYFIDAGTLFNYSEKKIYFSLWFLINIISICYYFSDRHYYEYEFRYIFRTFFESIIFFLITINLLKKLPFITH